MSVVYYESKFPILKSKISSGYAVYHNHDITIAAGETLEIDLGVYLTGEYKIESSDGIRGSVIEDDSETTTILTKVVRNNGTDDIEIEAGDLAGLIRFEVKPKILVQV